MLLCVFRTRANVPEHYSLPELIDHSQYILIGEIIAVEDTSYTLRVTSTIKGSKFTELTLRKDSTLLDHQVRWAPYEVGQTELAFIRWDPFDYRWELASPFGESELLLRNDSVYAFDPVWNLQENREQFPVHQMANGYRATPYSKDELVAAIVEFNKRSRFYFNHMSKEPDWIRARSFIIPMETPFNLTDPKLMEFQKRSPSHNRIICELMESPRYCTFPYNSVDMRYRRDNWILTRAYNALDYGRYEQALDLLTKELIRHPEKLNLYEYCGRCHFQLEQYDEAIADYSCYLKLFPDIAWTYYVRGLAYTAVNDTVRARSDFETALKLDPDRKFLSSGNVPSVEHPYDGPIPLVEGLHAMVHRLFPAIYVELAKKRKQNN